MKPVSWDRGYDNVLILFWVLVPCRLVGRCQSFGGTYCLHLQMKSTDESTRRQNPEEQHHHHHHHRRENLKSDNVLLGQGYRTSHTMVMVGYEAVKAFYKPIITNNLAYRSSRRIPSVIFKLKCPVNSFSENLLCKNYTCFILFHTVLLYFIVVYLTFTCGHFILSVHGSWRNEIIRKHTPSVHCFYSTVSSDMC
jgi:hypothetical protein